MRAHHVASALGSLLVTVAILAACTVQTSTPAPAKTKDSGAADAPVGVADAASPNTAGDSSGECNAIQNVGSVVTPTPKSGALPAGAGGSIADGTYVLSSVELYGGAAFPRVAATYQVKGTLLVTVSSFPDTGETSRDVLVLAQSGAAGTQTSTCASAASSSFEVTASGGTISFMLSDGAGGGVVLVLTRS